RPEHVDRLRPPVDPVPAVFLQHGVQAQRGPHPAVGPRLPQPDPPRPRHLTSSLSRKSLWNSRSTAHTRISGSVFLVSFRILVISPWYRLTISASWTDAGGNSSLDLPSSVPRLLGSAFLSLSVSSVPVFFSSFVFLSFALSPPPPPVPVSAVS